MIGGYMHMMRYMHQTMEAYSAILAALPAMRPILRVKSCTSMRAPFYYLHFEDGVAC